MNESAEIPPSSLQHVDACIEKLECYVSHE
jgi:hypothetical protein